MYKIYQYFISRITPFSIITNDWSLVSTHTQLVDAEVQLQRFLDQGVPLENLKIEQENLNE